MALGAILRQTPERMLQALEERSSHRVAGSLLHTLVTQSHTPFFFCPPHPNLGVVSASWFLPEAPARIHSLPFPVSRSCPHP